MSRVRNQAQRAALEVTIGELAPGGDGVATVEIAGERRAIFVRGTAPGDRVRIAADMRSRPARGEIVALLEAGALRVDAPCAFADRCGGCDWMHLAREGQRAAHGDHLRRALPEAFRSLPVTVHDAPGLGARSRARVHVRASGGRAVVGMHEAGTHDPVEVSECIILHSDLERARRALPALLEGAHGRGEAQLALGPLEGGPRLPVLFLRWSGALAPQCFARFEAATKSGAWAGISVLAGEATRPAVIGDPTPWMPGADGAPLRLPPGGFAQSSDEGNALLARRVLALAEQAAPLSGLRVAELFAGAGNFTVLLAAHGAEVIAVEQSEDACAAARENLAARGLSAKVFADDASEHAFRSGTQLVVLDPPRTGAKAVAARLAASRIRHVLYVSCDLATLGRDLALLAPTYDAKAVELVEMFPFTSHVETLVLLERRRG